MLKGKLLYLAYLALAGVMGVAGFYFVPKLVELPGSEVATTGPVAPGAGTAPAEGGGTAGGKSDRPAAIAGKVPPRFDILRVEPDGSTVVAGSGAPHSRLEIVSGDEVIAATEIGPSGDFAAVLDEPLPTGDYQLQLRTTDAEGEATTSEEVATVSIPKVESGELLAMVARPGEASRILTPPESMADEAGEEAQAPAAGGGNDEETADAKESAAPPATEPQDQQDQPAETAAAEPEEAPASEATAEMPAAPIGASEIAGSAPTIPLETGPAQDEAAAQDGAAAQAQTPTTEAAGEPDAPAGEKPEQEMAAASPQADSVQARPDAAGEARVRVDAVEVEGDRLFVAGAATPGWSVRVLADAKEIGISDVNDKGRFIVEAVAPLAVGDHQIAAELIDPQTGQVAMRAVVPFNRPEGEMVAAVSPESADLVPSEPAGDAVQAPAEEGAGAAATVPPSEPSGAEGSAETAGGSAPAAEAEQAETATSEAPAGEARVAEAPAGEATVAEAPAEDPVKGETAASGTAPAAETPISTAPETAASGNQPAEAEAEARVAMAEERQAPADGGGGEPATIEQAPLAPAEGSVIIRRGDTLWQISRRTYGQGVRYTTIYLANQQQIDNPDLITPGQIFRVPDEPVEDAERVHHELMRGRRPQGIN